MTYYKPEIISQKIPSFQKQMESHPEQNVFNWKVARETKMDLKNQVILKKVAKRKGNLKGEANSTK